MKALVKSRAEPGLWLEDVPEPEVGINDVLIRVDRTGICGTDVHIHRWDAWALRTIPVPLVIGHEFVGEIVDVGANVSDFRIGRPGERRGSRRLRALPELHGREAPPLRPLDRARRAASRRVRRVRLAADDQRLAPLAGHRRRGRRDLRSFRQCRPHRPDLPGPGRGRARHGRRPDRLHGGGRRSPRRCAPRRRHRPQPAIASSSRGASGVSLPSTRGSTTWESVQQELGMTEGFDVMFEMSGNPRRVPLRASRKWHTAAASRSSASPRHRSTHRPRPGDLQHAHA